jgi:hypothetical protein
MGGSGGDAPRLPPNLPSTTSAWAVPPGPGKPRAPGEKHSGANRITRLHPASCLDLLSPFFCLHPNSDSAMKDTEPMPELERGSPRLQRVVLRVIAAVSFIALPAIFAPRLTVEKFSVLLGFGKPPHLPLLIYMTSGASCVYLAQAILLWLMSRDVVRYRPLIVFCGWAYLAFSPLFLWIDISAGMPSFQVAADSLSCLVAGVALLGACYRGGKPRFIHEVTATGRTAQLPSHSSRQK